MKVHEHSSYGGSRQPKLTSGFLELAARGFLEAVRREVGPQQENRAGH